jgi:hypothetical protein
MFKERKARQQHHMRAAPRLPVVENGLALVGVARLAVACVHKRAWAMVHCSDRFAVGVHVLNNMLQLLTV